MLLFVSVVQRVCSLEHGIQIATRFFFFNRQQLTVTTQLKKSGRTNVLAQTWCLENLRT